MQLVFVSLTVLLLIVAVFALQNAEPVTVRFLHWQTQSSLAIVTLAATATGALVTVLLGVATRLVRWKRTRGAGPRTRGPTARPEPGSPSTPPAEPPPRPPHGS